MVLEQYSNYIFCIPEDITVPVVNGFAEFEQYWRYMKELLYLKTLLLIHLFNQRYILDNSFIDTSTIKVKVRSSASSTPPVSTYKQIDNIVGITSTSNSYLLQEIEDERYELIFGDNVIGKKLANDNYITCFLYCNWWKRGKWRFRIQFCRKYYKSRWCSDQCKSYFTCFNWWKSRDGDEIESISSIKYFAPRIYSSQYRAVTSSDYESVLGYIYPNVESVTAFGGEEMSPPRFGKVFISVKPRNGDFLSDETKRELVQKLKSYAVAGIVPEFVDLKYLYVELQTTPYYNPSLNDDPKILKLVFQMLLHNIHVQLMWINLVVDSNIVRLCH